MDIAHKTLAAFSLSLPALLVSSFAQASEGTDVAWLMSYYYNRTLDDCGKGRPLDQCSGLRVRGTDSGQAFQPWDPSPASQKSGGVSFSFLRKDAKYEDLGLFKFNGFVLKPNDFIDESKGEMKMDTLCFFPIDAWTDDRTEAGCADNTKTPGTEMICQKTPVNNNPNNPVDTSAEWVADYKKNRTDPPKYVTSHKQQCGFEIKRRDDAAQAFWEGIKARKAIANEPDTIKTQTEIRVPTWRADQDKQLPIMAFIYTPNAGDPSGSGLTKARDDQKRYYLETGKWVPVIRVDLPKTNAEDARFSYNESDQHRDVPKPQAQNECKSYIESATWEQRDDPNIQGKPWSLMIKPTACGRTMTKEQQKAAYAELFVKYGSDPRWQPDNGSMERQLTCHLEWSGDDNGKKVFTRDKPTWNLEPVRPVATWDETFKQGCNPY